ncbi:hypothetical protein FHG87_018145 [Trinorchestia longiramus]|nr:hypothetical protein FHG87_018145 [Trinorchestia longiramus]
MALQHVQSLQEQCRSRIVRLVKAKLLQERPTRGGIFAPVFASKNCPPLPPHSFSVKRQPGSSSGEQHLHDAIDRFISQEILGVPIEHLQDQMDPEADEPSGETPLSPSGESSQDRLSKSLSTSALAGEESEAPAHPPSQTSVSGGCNGSSSRARSSSESADRSGLIAEALGYRNDGKVIRICGKTLIASHSPCAVKRCGSPLNRHPPFRFRRPQFALDSSFGNVDESDDDEAPTIINSSRPFNFNSDDAHSSTSSSSSENHESLEESLLRHRTIKAFNAAKKSSETGQQSETSESNPMSSSTAEGGPSTVGSLTGSAVANEPTSSSCPNGMDDHSDDDGGGVKSTNEMPSSFDAGVRETQSFDRPISSFSSNSNARKTGESSQLSSTLNHLSDGNTTATTSHLVGCIESNNESRAPSTCTSEVARTNQATNWSLIDCEIDNCMGGSTDSFLGRPERNTRCSDNASSSEGNHYTRLPRRLSSDEEGLSDGGQSSDSSKSVEESCARTKAVKRQSVDDPRGRANRCKRSNRRSSGRSEEASVDGQGSTSSQPNEAGGVDNNSTSRSSVQEQLSRRQAGSGTNAQRPSLITPSFSLRLDRLEAAEERVNNRSRARRLSVLSLLSRLASSYVDENHRQLRRHRQTRDQTNGDDDPEQSVAESGGHQEIEVDEEDDEDEVGEEEEEDDSALSEDPSGDDVDEDVFMECGGGSRRLFNDEDKNYVESSDDEPEYFKEYLRKHNVPTANSSSEQRQQETEKKEPLQKSQQQKRRKKRKTQKPELWVRGTDGFDSYLDHKNNQKPFCKLPKEFRLEIRMLDRLHRLPLPPPIRDHLLLGNWTCKQSTCKEAFVQDNDDDMESLC